MKKVFLVLLVLALWSCNKMPPEPQRVLPEDYIDAPTKFVWAGYDSDTIQPGSILVVSGIDLDGTVSLKLSELDSQTSEEESFE